MRPGLLKLSCKFFQQVFSPSDFNLRNIATFNPVSYQMNSQSSPSFSPVVVFGWCFLLLPAFVTGDWRENFDSLSVGQSVTEAEGWRGFEDFPGDNPPKGVVVRGNALAISHTESFNGENFGLFYQLPEAYADGVVWIQARIKQPAEWTAGFYLDARGPESGQILARISASPSGDTKDKKRELLWSCTWAKYYWRLSLPAKLESENWHTLTARLDLDAKTYAVWVDEAPIVEEAPLASDAALTRLRLGFGGSPDSPALVDDLFVGRQAPDMQVPDLLPEPEDDLIFRFAAIGDPQLGFDGYEADVERFKMTVDQVNRSGAELSLILGDMAHHDEDIKAHEDLVRLAKGLNGPCRFIRGNHEILDMYQKYYHKDSNYAFAHKGVRFVVIDAIGNHAGLTEQQLAFVESEFSAASKTNEEIVLSLHVSPWENNAKGRYKYNQIGPGRARLRELMKEHKVALCLSGHLHTSLWGAKEEETQYLVLPGTALARTGPVSWCVMDVYPDRIVIHQKPLFFAYEKEGVKSLNRGEGWVSYEEQKKEFPYAVQGPLRIPRHRPVSKASARQNLTGHAQSVPEERQITYREKSLKKYDPFSAEEIWKRIPIPPSPALSPEEALKSFQVAPGFRVELVAAEPLVVDPVTFEFDPDGRIWAVEFRGWMLDIEGSGEADPICQVVVLEDTDGDTKMDKSTVFLDKLVMPRALAFVQGGVLVGEPPNLWYCRDTNGDLKCDTKVRVGNYGQAGNPEHTDNGLMHGIDNWMHSTDSDFRHRFRNGKLIEEPAYSRGQWGMTQDDYGRLFYCYESRPLGADLIPFHYAFRNRHLKASRRTPGLDEVIMSRDNTEVYPIRVTPGITLGGIELRKDGTFAHLHHCRGGVDLSRRSSSGKVSRQRGDS